MTIAVSHDPSFGPPSLPLPAAPAPAPSSTDAPEGPSAFAIVLAGLGREVSGGEALVRRAETCRAGDLGAPDLLALQAGVCRYGEAVDLAARLIDQARGTVKTVVEGQ
jgi:hypothetical protein